MKKFLASCIIFLGATVTMAHAIVLSIPDPEGNADVSSITPSTQISGDESSFFSSIQMVNKYLWMGLGLVCMVLLVYAGIGLITANGNDAKMKNSTKTLIGSVIGIMICIFSYAVVRLVVNLF
ncbi:MAG: hypothetical protein WCO66_00300 [Candidatus Absconditabacteria bacterium]